MNSETLTLVFGLGNFILIIVAMLAIIGAIAFFGRYVTLVPDIHSRISVMERILLQLSSDVASNFHDDNVKEVWQTADGKYTANSFEELLSTMASDPETPLTEEEIEAIKSVFDKIASKNNNPNDDDE